MSRGSFNGPGGTHTRCLIPPTQGASLGSQHNIRNKRFLNFVTDNDLLRLNRNGLAQSGIAVADVTAREVPHAAGEVAGVQHRARRHAATSRRRATAATDPLCDGVRPQGTTVTGKYNDYTMEVVQQIGSDSFDPGHGVLISKTKNSVVAPAARSLLRVGRSTRTRRTSTRSTSSRPDGTPKMATIGDARQLNDALVQRGPELGLLVRVRRPRQPPALLRRRQAHRRAGHPALQGRREVARRRRPADARRRAAVGAAAEVAAGRLGDLHVHAQEHGRGGGDRPGAAPAGRDRVPASDVYRLSASATGTGWSAQLINALTDRKFGETITGPGLRHQGRGTGAGHGHR